MKTSILARLHYRADSEGRHAVLIQVIHNRRRSTVNIPYRILPSEFDNQKGFAFTTKRTQANRAFIREVNDCISACFKMMREAIEVLECQGVPYDVSDIMATYHRLSDNHYVETFAGKLIAELEATGRFGTARSYRSLMSVLERFWGQNRCLFRQVDSSMISAFALYLERLGLRRNSISFYLRTFRALYNRARRAGYAPEGNPFSEVSFRAAQTPKLAVNRELLRNLARSDFGNALLNEARDMFLFSCAPVKVS